VTEDERRRLLDILQATPATLKAALKGVPRKLLLWRPAPGKWSILEIVCHMRDMEREAYLARYQRILAEDEPSLPDIEGEALAIERDYRSQSLATVLRDWTSLRKQNLRLLKGVKGAAWQRVGVHATGGRLAVEDFLRRHALGNDEAHLGQIDAIKRRHGILQRLAAAPKLLADAVKGVGAEAARRRAADGKWSILENVCHLRDIEFVYAARFARMPWQDKPAFWMLDNDKAARELRYAQQDLGRALKEFAARRADTLQLLRALPHAAWQRTGLHPIRGEMTIEALADFVSLHDGRHIDRIRGLR
jgi:hypothetical protein